MIDDILEIADETHTGTIEEIPVMFRAYIAHDKTEKLVWRIGDTLGNNAMLDKIEGLVILPQSREVKIDGRMSHYVQLPRWMADALMNDFDTFTTKTIDPIHDETDDDEDDTNPSNTDDGFTPIFDEETEE